MPRIISGLDKDSALEHFLFYLGRLKTNTHIMGSIQIQIWRYVEEVGWPGKTLVMRWRRRG